MTKDLFIKAYQLMCADVPDMMEDAERWAQWNWERYADNPDTWLQCRNWLNSMESIEPFETYYERVQDDHHT